MNDFSTAASIFALCFGLACLLHGPCFVKIEKHYHVSTKRLKPCKMAGAHDEPECQSCDGYEDCRI
jgi:hypothetical protein